MASGVSGCVCVSLGPSHMCSLASTSSEVLGKRSIGSCDHRSDLFTENTVENTEGRNSCSDTYTDTYNDTKRGRAEETRTSMCMCMYDRLGVRDTGGGAVSEASECQRP